MKQQPAMMSTQTCPDCGGGLWESTQFQELQWHCDLCHLFTASALAHEQSVKTSNLIWASLRALHEKQTLSTLLASDAAVHGWAERVEEYDLAASVSQSQGEKLRQVLGALNARGTEVVAIASLKGGEAS